MVKEKKTGKRTARRDAGKSSFKSFMGGSILASEKVVARLPLLFFLVFLGILLITNGYWAEKTIRRIEAENVRIKDLKSRSEKWEIELIKVNRPSEIVNRVRKSGLDLMEPTQPHQILKVKKTKDDEL